MQTASPHKISKAQTEGRSEMCEKCEQRDEEQRQAFIATMREEIEGLADHRYADVFGEDFVHETLRDAPVSDKISAEDTMELVALGALAARCAMLANALMHGGKPPSIIMGEWAGMLMETEMRRVELSNMISGLLGALDNRLN